MPGRYGVSSRSHVTRTGRSRAARGIRIMATTCIAVTAGAFGLADTANAPEDSNFIGAPAPKPSRDAGDDVSRSADREPPPAPKALRSPGPGFGPPQPQRTATPKPNPNVKPAATAELPAKSGSGHRVVFDITAQQVWLVNSKNAVVRTYLVSGSRFDQLPTGTFEVFSKSRDAVSWHGTETMEYMVRFYRGENSNIGFHDIPVATATGEEVQTLSQLGTPLSDGCIRQDLEDAVALWEHTPVGTPIVVVRT